MAHGPQGHISQPSRSPDGIIVLLESDRSAGAGPCGLGTGAARWRREKMVNPPRLLFDLERADRVTRSVASMIEHCSRLREQQRSLLSAMRANLGHIQSAHESGNSMLEALRKGALPKGSPTEQGADSRLISGVDFARFRLTAREAQVAELLALGR